MQVSQTSPPLCIPAEEPPSPTLSYASPVPPRSSLPKPEVPHVLSAKTEPQRLRFWLFGSNQAPSRAPCPIPGPHDLKHSVIHPNKVYSALKKTPPRFVGQNRAPAAQFWILAPTRRPLTPHPIASPHHLKPGVPHLNVVPSTRKRTSPHFVRQSQALVARFQIWPGPPHPRVPIVSHLLFPPTPMYPRCTHPQPRFPNSN